MTKRIQLKGSLIPNDYQEIYDFIKKDGTSASRLIEQLPEDNSEVVIEVNSFGGLVTVGSEMYTALRNYKGKVTAEVTGMVAKRKIICHHGRRQNSHESNGSNDDPQSFA